MRAQPAERPYRMPACRSVIVKRKIGRGEHPHLIRTDSLPLRAIYTAQALPTAQRRLSNQERQLSTFSCQTAVSGGPALQQ